MNNDAVVYEEDVEALQEKFQTALGANGKYNISGRFTKLFSPRYGILWYGDLATEDVDKVAKFAIEMDIPVEFQYFTETP